MVVEKTSPTPQELTDLVTEGVNAVNDLYGRRMAFMVPKPNYRPRRDATITVIRKTEPKV